MVTAAYQASRVLSGAVTLTADQVYLEQRGKTKRQDLEDHYRALIALGLCDEQERDARLGSETDFGSSTFVIENRFDAAACDTMFLAGDGTPHGAGHYEGIARHALLALIPADDPTRSFRRLALESDAVVVARPHAGRRYRAGPARTHPPRHRARQSGQRRRVHGGLVGERDEPRGAATGGHAGVPGAAHRCGTGWRCGVPQGARAAVGRARPRRGHHRGALRRSVGRARDGRCRGAARPARRRDHFEPLRGALLGCGWRSRGCRSAGVAQRPRCCQSVGGQRRTRLDRRGTRPVLAPCREPARRQTVGRGQLQLVGRAGRQDLHRADSGVRRSAAGARPAGRACCSSRTAAWSKSRRVCCRCWRAGGSGS